MKSPIISIIIPVYNGETYLSESIQSALNQTWPCKEIIIVDDGSTDNSLQIAKGFASDTVKIFTQQNSGAAAARNMGLKQAKGDYIQFLDADDLLSPDKIEAQLTCLEGSLSKLAICRTTHFDGDITNIIDEPADGWLYNDSNSPIDFLTKLYAGEDVLPGYGGMITIHSWLTPRALIDKTGPWNEQLSLDDDGEFFCRVVLASEGIKFSKNGVNYYRKFVGAQSLSAQKTRKGIESAILAIDLKLDHLKRKSGNGFLEKIFAKHYWWTGVLAYPQFKDLSAHCIKRAKQLDYRGQRYVGGPTGHALAGILGWKAARQFVWWRQMLKQSWA